VLKDHTIRQCKHEKIILQSKEKYLEFGAMFVKLSCYGQQTVLLLNTQKQYAFPNKELLTYKYCIMFLYIIQRPVISKTQVRI
jgi:hypothetical protein